MSDNVTFAFWRSLAWQSYIAARQKTNTAIADSAVGTRINAAEKDCDAVRSRADDDSAGDASSKPAQRESVESLEGLLSAV